MIFCGALVLGNVSLLFGLVSFLGSRRDAFVVLVVGNKLFGAAGGGISSVESTSCSLDEAVLVRLMPGREACCGGPGTATGVLAAPLAAGCRRLEEDDIAEGVFAPIALAF